MATDEIKAQKDWDAQGTNPRTLILSSGRSVTLRDYPDGNTVEFDWTPQPSPREMAVMIAIVNRVRWGATLEQCVDALDAAELKYEKIPKMTDVILACPRCGREEHMFVDGEALSHLQALQRLPAHLQETYLTCNACNTSYVFKRVA
jgi:4-hydroxy-3-methylbut-2-en-1-yl diphosphate synthase IspG/GcpE